MLIIEVKMLKLEANLGILALNFSVLFKFGLAFTLLKIPNISLSSSSEESTNRGNFFASFCIYPSLSG